MMKKHLLEGVKKGAFTVEEAEVAVNLAKAEAIAKKLAPPVVEAPAAEEVAEATEEATPAAE